MYNKPKKKFPNFSIQRHVFHGFERLKLNWLFSAFICLFRTLYDLISFHFPLLNFKMSFDGMSIFGIDNKQENVCTLSCYLIKRQFYLYIAIFLLGI